LRSWGRILVLHHGGSARKKTDKNYTFRDIHNESQNALSYSTKQLRKANMNMRLSFTGD
jgi:hypothetical protein